MTARVARITSEPSGVMRGAILACAIGVPLVIAPGLVLEYETTPKVAILLVATAILLGCPAHWWSSLRSLARSKEGKLFFGMGALQLLSLTVSTAGSAQVPLSLSGSPAHRLGLVTQAALVIFSWIVAAYFAADRSRLRPVLTAFVGVGAAIALYAIAQYFGWDPFLSRALYTTNFGGDLVRPPGTLENGVYLGAFLGSVLPFAVALGLEGRGRARWAYWTLGGLLCVAIALGGSRSAVLGAFTAAAIVAWPRPGVAKQFLSRLAAAAGVLAIGMALFAQLPAGASFALRLAQWRQDPVGGPRLGVWRDSLALIRERPVLGFGPDSFGNEFRKRQSVELSRAYPDFYNTSPHNILIDVAVAQGIAGVAILCGLLYLVYAPAPPGPDSAVRWTQASVTSLLICLMFNPTTIPNVVMLYFLLATAVALRVKTVEAPAVAAPSLARFAGGTAALVLAAAAAAYVVQDLAYTDLGRAARGGDGVGMVAAYRRASGMWFPGAGEDLWCSRQFASLARQSQGEWSARAWQLAAAASGRAETTGDDGADATFQSALLAISSNQGALAEQKLRQAIQRAPNWYKPHLLLAQLLSYTGRPQEAQAEAQLAAERAGPPRK